MLFRTELFELWCRSSSCISVTPRKIKNKIQTKETGKYVSSSGRDHQFGHEGHYVDHVRLWWSLVRLFSLQWLILRGSSASGSTLEDPLFWYIIALNFIKVQLGDFLCMINYYVNGIIWFVSLMLFVNFLFNFR